jgi:hypothetical protein
MSVGRSEGSPVAFFEELYAIVVGLGLALAVEQVIDLNRSGVPVVTEHVPLFLAYLNIAFALAHASVRYLQLAYDEAAIGDLGRGRIIGDLVLGVGHFLLLMALSFLITRPSAFFWAALALLMGRPLRDGLLALAGKTRLDFDRKVALIHLVTMGALGAILLLGTLASHETGIWVLRIGGLLASLLFGLGLYILALPYFFPGAKAAR